MMGHQRQGARKNYDFDDTTIKEAYAKAFDYLSINGVQVRTDLNALRMEFNVTIKSLSKTIAELQEALKTKDTQIEKLRREFNIPEDYLLSPISDDSRRITIAERLLSLEKTLEILKKAKEAKE